MYEDSGLDQGWSHAEDDLILQFVHVSQPGGRFDGPRQFARWPMIAENVAAMALTLGFKRTYSRELCAMRYSRYILPHITLGAAQNRLDFGWKFSDGSRESEPYKPNQSVLRWLHRLHLAGAAAREPVDAALSDLVNWENLVKWAVQVEEYPRLLFEEHGQVLEFVMNPDVAVAEENPMKIKSQYELNYFNETLGLVQNIVRRNEQDDSTVLVAL